MAASAWFHSILKQYGVPHSVKNSASNRAKCNTLRSEDFTPFELYQQTQAELANTRPAGFVCSHGLYKFPRIVRQALRRVRTKEISPDEFMQLVSEWRELAHCEYQQYLDQRTDKQVAHELYAQASDGVGHSSHTAEAAKTAGKELAEVWQRLNDGAATLDEFRSVLRRWEKAQPVGSEIMEQPIRIFGAVEVCPQCGAPTDVYLERHYVGNHQTVKASKPCGQCRISALVRPVGRPTKKDVSDGLASIIICPECRQPETWWWYEIEIPGSCRKMTGDGKKGT